MNINTNIMAASRPRSEWQIALPEVGRNGMSTSTRFAAPASRFAAVSASQHMYVQVLGNGTDAYTAAPQITRDHDVPATSTKLGSPPRGVPR